MADLGDGDRIRIEQLEVSASIGVTVAERAQPQRLCISVTLWPRPDFSALDDELAKTTDYSAVCAAIRQLVNGRRDKLIETLANALATELLKAFSLRAIEIEIRKFVIPDADHVSVVITRKA